MQQFIPFYEGLSIGFGLTIAIRLQNAFVIKQGTLKNQVFIISLICWLIDAILISLGVAGFGYIISYHYISASIAKYAAALFLTYYGVRSFRNAFSEKILYVSNDNTPLNLSQAALTALSLSLLNPHIYLDTCLLLGSIGAQFEMNERLNFAFGAISASFLWFFGIGYGAKLCLPFFQNPVSWKILDIIIAIVMCGLAISLLIWTPYDTI